MRKVTSRQTEQLKMSESCNKRQNDALKSTIMYLYSDMKGRNQVHSIISRVIKKWRLLGGTLKH
jgi:hypothetical protein